MRRGKARLPSQAAHSRCSDTTGETHEKAVDAVLTLADIGCLSLSSETRFGGWQLPFTRQLSLFPLPRPVYRDLW